MKSYRIRLKLLSAFGTPLVGDTLFGQICWAIRHRFGEDRLNDLLQGYVNQQPFLVVSDAMPKEHLPLPHLPSCYWITEKGKEEDRKVLKKKQWVTLTDTQQAVNHWQKMAKAEKDLFEKQQRDQPHNSISRQSGTTSESFAPYSSSQIWYGKEVELDLYCVLDEQKWHVDELKKVLSDIGAFGFGRDATIGLGRFKVENVEDFTFKALANPTSYLTLANTAPQGLALNKAQSYYQITTRFGRHGGITGLSANPFKKPIILAKAGAVFTPLIWQDRLFLGNGLVNISYADPNAVHQGYAPVLPISIDFDIKESV